MLPSFSCIKWSSQEKVIQQKKVWLLWIIRQWLNKWFRHIRQYWKSVLFMPPVKNCLSFCLPQWRDWVLKLPTHKQVTGYMNIILLFYCLYWNNLTTPNNYFITGFPQRPTLKSSLCCFYQSYPPKLLCHGLYPILIKLPIERSTLNQIQNLNNS